MASRTRFRSSILMGRGNDQTTTGIGKVLAAQSATFDPTAASAATTITLPKGAMPVLLVTNGGATGGTNPTVDVGVSGTGAFFGNEIDADAATLTAPLSQAVLAADTIVFAGVGASAATGGTVRLTVLYWIDPTNQKDPSSE